MQVHSRVGLVTNSSSETYSFAALGRTQDAVDTAVERLWAEYCSAEENQDLLRQWWNGDWSCTGRSPNGSFFGSEKRGDNAQNPYSIAKAVAFGSPVQFLIQYDGKAEFDTSMDNGTASDEFCRFVETRMSSEPFISGEMRSICEECQARGRNTCPPCRL